jgi:hypothetical protein
VAEMSREEIEQIVEEQMPGWAVVSEESAAVDSAPNISAEPEAHTPDIDALRRKYLGEGAADVTGSLASDNTDLGASDEGVEDAVIVVEPKQEGDVWDHGPGPKTVIISGKEKKIIGAQG